MPIAKAVGRTLRIVKPPADTSLTTDPALLVRVLMNMITNALEATGLAEEARLCTEAGDGGAMFLVWNRQVISPDVALRVFQRYFTTKVGSGCGLGTFAMKWLTEKYLKGKVDFTSTEVDGTTFRLWMPERL